MFGDGKAFTFPKPRALIEHLIELSTDKKSLILDSFAGSGTTGHAVLSVNSREGGSRRFILVEMEDTIARDITAKRLSMAVNGYQDQRNGKNVDGLDSGFRFCKLGGSLFDEIGNIAESVKLDDLAAHVFFTETGIPLSQPATDNSPLLGVHEGKAVYLMFNGMLGDKRINGGNVLTGKVLSDFPPHGGPKVIYGEGCRLSSQRLRREGIVFKQVPYEIRVS